MGDVDEGNERAVDGSDQNDKAPMNHSESNGNSSDESGYGDDSSEREEVVNNTEEDAEAEEAGETENEKTDEEEEAETRPPRKDAGTPKFTRNPTQHLYLGDTFPNLKGPTQYTNDFDLYEYLGSDSWGIIFLHPGDFTPVCTTELGEAAKRDEAFASLRTKMCAFSCNSAASHRAWIRDIAAATGGKVKFPLFCDADRSLSKAYGFLDPDNIDHTSKLPMTVRSVYILHPCKRIELILTYPACCGRSFDEIFRVLESLQRKYKRGGAVATPVDWHPGQDVIVDFKLSNRQADEKFGPSGYEVVEVPSEQGRWKRDLEKNYLRTTKDELLVPYYDPEAEENGGN